MQSIGICNRVFQIVVRGGGGGRVNYLTSKGSIGSFAGRRNFYRVRQPEE